jgi:hypothetical protein
MISKNYVVFLIAIIIVAILAGGLFLFELSKQNNQKNVDGQNKISEQIKNIDNSDKKTCPPETKLCPDGSRVEKKGPNCEFDACPAFTKSGIRGTVLLGPICTVENNISNSTCAGKPYSVKLVINTADQKKYVSDFTSDENGKFSVEVPPGEYFIGASATTPNPPYCSQSGIIKVNKGVFTDVKIYCDTGIK